MSQGINTLPEDKAIQILLMNASTLEIAGDLRRRWWSAKPKLPGIYGGGTQMIVVNIGLLLQVVST
jgi:hypothetical protein